MDTDPCDLDRRVAEAVAAEPVLTRRRLRSGRNMGGEPMSSVAGLRRGRRGELDDSSSSGDGGGGGGRSSSSSSSSKRGKHTRGWGRRTAGCRTFCDRRGCDCASATQSRQSLPHFRERLPHIDLHLDHLLARTALGLGLEHGSGGCQAALAPTRSACEGEPCATAVLQLSIYRIILSSTMYA